MADARHLTTRPSTPSPRHRPATRTRAPKSQTLRTLEAIAHAKAIGKEVELRDRRQPDQGPHRHDDPRGRPAARHPHPHALLPRGPLPGRGVPRVRGRDRRPADAPGGVQLSDHHADRGPHPFADRAPRPAAHPRPAAWPPTTASATPAPATTTASFRPWPWSTASISSASATRRPPRYADRRLQPLRWSATTTSASSAAAASAPASTCRRSACWRPSTAATARSVSTFMGKPLADVICINCGQCINRCPTGALRANDSTDEVWAAIDDPDKHVVIQTAPSPRAAIGECFGLAPGTALTFELNTALRRCGFDKVFDTNFAADLTILEEGDRAAAAAEAGAGRRGPVGRACRSSPVARPAGSSTSSTSIPSTCRTSPRPRARSRCSARC